MHFALLFYTRQLPCFGELRSLFYINKVKIVPENIYNILTPVALAHLVMGDGIALERGLIISTDSYKIVDVVRIMNVLIIRYNIDCRLRFHTPTQPRIYIREHSMLILRGLVKPYMTESMFYKIGLGSFKSKERLTRRFFGMKANGSAFFQLFVPPPPFFFQSRGQTSAPL